jgi:hypothetical protein
MLSIINIFYLILAIIFLAFGAAIVFHLLYYRINRHVAGVMSLIYIAGAALLLISNYILFTQVNWDQVFGNLKL